MPQIQVLDNPYQGVMGQAAQGIAGLTNAASEREKRRAMEWQRIKDLPEGMQRIAKKDFAESTGLVDSPGILDSIIGYFRDEPKGIASFAPKPSSAIERAGAGVQQAQAPAPSAPAREFDPNRVSKQTLEMLGGNAETLSRGRSGPIGTPVASIEHGPGGENTFIKYNADGTVASESSDPRAYFSDLAAQNHAEIAQRAADSNEYASGMASHNAGTRRVMSDLGKNWDSNPEFTSWAVRNKMPMDAANIKGTLDAFVNSKIGAAPQAPQGKTLSDLARENGPSVYDERTAQTHQAVAYTPIASQNPAARLIGAQSSRGSQSFSGNMAFSRQGSGLSREEMDFIDSVAKPWSSNDSAMAQELAFAGTIADPEKKAAAMQYITTKYPTRMSSYDNGVTVPKISTRESYGNSRSNGGGDGSGAGSFEGFIPVRGGDAGSQWVKIRRLPETQFDSTTRALYTMLSTTGENDKEIMADMQKIHRLAAAGDGAANKLLEMASGDTGAKFINSKIYSSKEANYKLDPTIGISVADLSPLLRRVRNREVYDGPNTELDVEWSPFDKPVERGKVYDKSTVDLAGALTGAKKNSGKTVSDIAKKKEP